MKTVVIDGKQLTKEEVAILEELVTAGYDAQFEDWSIKEEKKYRAFTDKYFPNE